MSVPPPEPEGPALSKEQYQALRARLTFDPSPVLAVLTLLVNAALLALAVWLLRGPTLPHRLLSYLVFPMVFFQAFSILHECGHGSFSSSRLVNTLVGHYASVLCFMPFFPWKYIHTEHHTWTGNPDGDPGLSLVRRARAGGLPWLLRATWRVWFPLGGFAQHLVYWSYPLAAWRKGKLKGGRLARAAASVAFLGFAYVGLRRLAPAVVDLVALAPALFMYLLLVELVNIPHHVGLTSIDERLPVWRQHLATRSCDYPPVVSELVVLNFNFHTEHHAFPTLPWYRLRTARALLRPALGASYRDAHGLRWHLDARGRSLPHVLHPGSPGALRE